MPFISVIYASDNDLLREVSKIIASHVDEVAEVAEVDAPATLDLDFATMAQQIWQLLIVFGTVKASLESIELIVKLLRERKTRGKTSRVEFTVPSGAKITLEGNMTPDELAKELKRYEAAFPGPQRATS